MVCGYRLSQFDKCGVCIYDKLFSVTRILVVDQSGCEMEDVCASVAKAPAVFNSAL